jgi:hypothetical protein
MGKVAGYTVTGFLVQHASRERRYARVPASTWNAISSYIRDPADTARLANAKGQLLSAEDPYALSVNGYVDGSSLYYGCLKGTDYRSQPKARPPVASIGAAA